MNNKNATTPLYEAWRNYHAEKMAQEKLIRRQSEAKLQQWLWLSLKNSLTTLGAKLKAQSWSNAVAPIQRVLHLGH
jgi:hypothetical protein